jgi:tetratricopeptide (TPR) repeat protein
MECYVRQLEICEELGNRKGMMYAIGNMGDVHSDQGRYAEALEHYVRAIEGDRAIGYRSGILSWLEGIAGTLLKVLAGSAGEMPEYLIALLPGATSETWQGLLLQHARECTEECIAISDELSEPEEQFSSRILLGRIEAAEGHVDTGVERLDAMLVEATDDDQRAELHYWLWKLGSAGHAAIALALYESLFAATPKHDYHKRIEELKATGETT